MDEIRTAALAAVADVGPAWNGGARVLQATKIVREATGCDLKAAVEAVKWAIDRPAAASLPPHTIVGSRHVAWFKDRDGWVSTHTERWHSDDEIDVMLRSDQATILRVGGGA